MTEFEIKETFRFILELLKQQALYVHRQHGWLIALAETIERDPALVSELKNHPFYDQGPEWRIQSIDVLLQNIEIVLQQVQR
jgi:hypothetical protein